MKISGWLAMGLACALLVVPATQAATAGGSYSAVCKDGASWSGTSKRGACRGHKGVQSWSDSGTAAAAAPAQQPAASGTHKSRSKASASASGGMAAPMATTSATASGSMSATCKDGTPWSGSSRRGACRGHQGVQSWADGTAAAATPAPMSRPSATTTPAATNTAAAGGNVSATCKDGTPWSGSSRRGACRGHQGVQTWGAAAAAPAPATPGRTVPAVPAPAPMPMNKPAVPNNAAVAQAPGGGAGMVWVNASSKVYHCQNDRWYGKTKQGQYMTEAQAVAQGNHPDHGKACH